MRARSVDALRELFWRHGGALHAFASLLVPSEAEADRAVARVFVDLWQRGELEVPVEDVRLGLMAMALRRSACGRPSAASEAPPAPPFLRLIDPDDREAFAAAVLVRAPLDQLAVALRRDRASVARQIRAGLVTARRAGPAADEHGGRRGVLTKGGLADRLRPGHASTGDDTAAAGR